MDDLSKWDKYKVPKENNDLSRWDKYKVSKSNPIAPEPKSKSSFFDKILSGLERYGNERLNESQAMNAFNIGGAQQIGSMGANALNAIPGVNVPHPELERFLPEGEQYKGLSEIGKLSYGVPAEIALARLLGKAPGLSNEMASLGAAGALTYGESPSERLIGGLLGAGIPAAKSAIEGAGKVVKSIPHLPKSSNKAIGEKVLSRTKELDKHFNERFGNIFKSAEERGVKKITSKLPKNEVDAFKRIAPSKIKYSLDDFMKNPSLKNGHKLQSAIGSFERSYEGAKLLPSQARALEAAKILRDTLKNNINNQFNFAGAEDLAKQLTSAERDYAKFYGHYLDNKAISAAMQKPGSKGYIYPHRIAGELHGKKGDAFKAAAELAGEEYPELAINELLTPTWRKGAGFGSSALAINEAQRLFDRLKNK